MTVYVVEQEQLFFWVGMNVKIKQLVDNCVACQYHKPNNQKETFKQHEEEVFRGKIRN